MGDAQRQAQLELSRACGIIDAAIALTANVLDSRTAVKATHDQSTGYATSLADTLAQPISRQRTPSRSHCVGLD